MLKQENKKSCCTLCFRMFETNELCSKTLKYSNGTFKKDVAMLKHILCKECIVKCEEYGGWLPYQDD